MHDGLQNNFKNLTTNKIVLQILLNGKKIHLNLLLLLVKPSLHRLIVKRQFIMLKNYYNFFFKFNI